MREAHVHVEKRGQAQEWGFESRIGALEKSSGAEAVVNQPCSQAGDASKGGRLKG